jgi:hypothetical protein
VGAPNSSHFKHAYERKSCDAFFCAEKGLRDEYCACNHGFVLYLYAKIGAEIACADKKKTWND